MANATDVVRQSLSLDPLIARTVNAIDAMRSVQQDEGDSEGSSGKSEASENSEGGRKEDTNKICIPPLHKLREVEIGEKSYYITFNDKAKFAMVHTATGKEAMPVNFNIAQMLADGIPLQTAQAPSAPPVEMTFTTGNMSRGAAVSVQILTQESAFLRGLLSVPGLLVGQNISIMNPFDPVPVPQELPVALERCLGADERAIMFILEGRPDIVGWLEVVAEDFEFSRLADICSIWRHERAIPTIPLSVPLPDHTLREVKIGEQTYYIALNDKLKFASVNTSTGRDTLQVDFNIAQRLVDGIPLETAHAPSAPLVKMTFTAGAMCPETAMVSATVQILAQESAFLRGLLSIPDLLVDQAISIVYDYHPVSQQLPVALERCLGADEHAIKFILEPRPDLVLRLEVVAEDYGFQRLADIFSTLRRERALATGTHR